MEKNSVNNTTNENGQEGDFEARRREQEAAADVEVNHPDAILNETEDEERGQRDELNKPGDNLTDQHPTQDQTAGESGVSGRDDEAYDNDEFDGTQR